MPTTEVNGEDVQVGPFTGREIDSIKEIFEDLLRSQAESDEDSLGLEELTKTNEIQHRCKEIVVKNTSFFQETSELDELPSKKRRELMQMVMQEVVDDMGFIQGLQQ